MYTVIYKQEAAGRTPDQWFVGHAADNVTLQAVLNTLSKEGYTIFQVLYRGN